MGTNDRTLNIVGESFRNEDGSNRQAEIRRFRTGHAVQLRREPHNRFDPMAVGVFSNQGVQIGYRKAEHSQWIGARSTAECT